jgi:exosortase family protein XrtF
MPQAVKFIAVFLGVYIAMQLAYTGYLMIFAPGIDGLSYQTAKWVISFFDGGSMREIPGAAKMQLAIYGKVLININEGCNGLSVFIALVSFLIAFGGTHKAYLIFIPLSLVILFGSNILRLCSLIQIKSSLPKWFNLFHDFVFPTVLYLVAFLIMVVWVKLGDRRG